MHRGDGEEVHRVDDGLRLVELGRQRLARVDTVRNKTIYRSTSFVWVYEQQTPSMCLWDEFLPTTVWTKSSCTLLIKKTTYYNSSLIPRYRVLAYSIYSAYEQKKPVSWVLRHYVMYKRHIYDCIEFMSIWSVCLKTKRIYVIYSKRIWSLLKRLW